MKKEKTKLEKQIEILNWMEDEYVKEIKRLTMLLFKQRNKVRELKDEKN